MTAIADRPAGRESANGISDEEFSQRVAVLRRFRALLAEQRNHFQSYLEALDRQRQVIETGTTEELIAHVELEEKIVSDIFSIQKVIDPLDEMYRAVYSGNAGTSGYAAGDDGVSGLKSALEKLKSEAAARSGRNRDLLSRRMAELRSEITALRSNPYLQSSRSAVPASRLVDISG
jgi:hypothetical protein